MPRAEAIRSYWLNRATLRRMGARHWFAGLNPSVNDNSPCPGRSPSRLVGSLGPDTVHNAGPGQFLASSAVRWAGASSFHEQGLSA